MEDRQKQSMNVDKLIQQLNAKWQGRPCPMCGKNNFTISDKIFELSEFHGGDIVFGVKEWCFLKEKISKIKVGINTFHSIGYLLLGALFHV